MVGNLLEWYDFSLYGYFSPIIARLFFPNYDPFISLISTFAVFAAGFLMRPLGALFFGYLGDRVGRKHALLFSLLLISLPTIFIGLLPTYETAGILAPILLTFLRLLQGLSAGGEYTSSIIFLTEHAKSNRKGFAGSFALFGSGTGMLLGSLACAIVTASYSQENLNSWGWRLPFLFGIFTMIFGFFLRKGAKEPAEFQKIKASGTLAQNPLKEIAQSQKVSIGVMIGFNLLSTIAGYLLYAYMPTYLHKVIGLPLSDALFLNAISLGWFNLVVPFAGLLSDHVGRKVLFLCGATAFAILSYPLFLLFAHGTFLSCLLAMMIFTVMIAMYHGPLPAAMAEFFPVKVRASAVAIAYNFAASLFSGTCPLVASILIQATGNPLSPAFYLMVAALISFTVIALQRVKTPALNAGHSPFHFA